MKAALFVLVVSISAGSLIATCSNLNSYLEAANSYHLSKTGQTLKLSAPVSDYSGRCNHLWRFTNTCCNTNAAVTYASNERNIINSASLKLTESLQTLHNLANNIGTNANMPEFAKWYLLSYKVRPSGIDQSINICRDYLAQKRGSVVCSFCRPDSAKFFINSKGLISGESCSEMLMHCGKVIEFVATAVGRMHTLTSKVSSSPAYESTFNNLFKALRNAHLGSDVVQYIHSYMQYNSNAPNYATLSKTICDRFYSLVKQSFLEDLSKLLGSVTAIMKYFSTTHLSGTLLFYSDLAIALLSIDPSRSLAQAPSRSMSQSRSRSLNVFDATN